LKNQPAQSGQYERPINGTTEGQLYNMGIELKMRTERNMDNDSQVDNELKPLSAEHATSEKAELDTQVAGLQSKSAGAQH
jgi:hypothetical protein